MRVKYVAFPYHETLLKLTFLPDPRATLRNFEHSKERDQINEASFTNCSLQVCHLTEEIFQKSLISLPPIKLRGISLEEIEIWTDHSDLIAQLLVPEFSFTAMAGPDGIITVTDWQAERIVQRIGKCFRWKVSC